MRRWLEERGHWIAGVMCGFGLPWIDVTHNAMWDSAIKLALAAPIGALSTLGAWGVKRFLQRLGFGKAGDL